MKGGDPTSPSHGVKWHVLSKTLNCLLFYVKNRVWTRKKPVTNNHSRDITRKNCKRDMKKRNEIRRIVKKSGHR